MKEDILKAGHKNVEFVHQINRELTEKALYMRCLSYLAKVKESLLLQTIYEIDSSKKGLKKMNTEILSQQEIILNQKKELEDQNKELKKFREELERLVKERTKKWREANHRLRREIEERKRIEKEKNKYWQQLVQSQKIESTGKVAGGIAHDFNNLLTAVLGYCQLALREVKPGSKLNKELTGIMTAGEKCAALIRHLLTLSRKKSFEIKEVNLNQVIGNLEPILARMLGKHYKLEFKKDEALPEIEADICQLEQILINLTVNAKDAMPGGGRLIIKTSMVKVEKRSQKLPGLPAGQYALLSVTDTGEGIPREIQDKIFEPFFSTKPEGKGTGLGLSTIFSIIKQYNSHIILSSETDKGTTFDIYFKAVGRPGVSMQTHPMPTGKETVLIADNDPAIRTLAGDTLGILGYRVLKAVDGLEALRICQTKKVDLLITDIVMPELNGLDLNKIIEEKYPDIEVLLISSYTGKVLFKENDSLKNKLFFLQKPFTPSGLASKIRQIMDNQIELIN